MGLESVTYIDDLIVTNPTPEDKRREGDDHLRNIKKALKNSFPQISGPVFAGHVELSYLNGASGNIQAQLNAKLEQSDLNLEGYAQIDTRQSWTASQTIEPINFGSVGGTVILNCALSDTFILTVTSNVTLRFSSLVQGSSVTIKIIQGSQGTPAVVTLPTEMAFAYAEDPVLTTTYGKYDVIVGKYIQSKMVCSFIPEPA